MTFLSPFSGVAPRRTVKTARVTTTALVIDRDELVCAYRGGCMTQFEARFFNRVENEVGYAVSIS